VGHANRARAQVSSVLLGGGRPRAAACACGYFHHPAGAERNTQDVPVTHKEEELDLLLLLVKLRGIG